MNNLRKSLESLKSLRSLGRVGCVQLLLLGLLAAQCDKLSVTSNTANSTAACTTQTQCTAAYVAMSNTADAGAQTVVVNPLPGNVSTLDPHALVPAGTKIIAHLMLWFTSPKTGDHGQTKYNSNDLNSVVSQMTQMIAQHLDGLSADWYSQFDTAQDGTMQKVRDNLDARCISPQNCPLEMVVTEDQGAVTRTNGTRTGCTSADGTSAQTTCLQNAIKQDLCYMNATYFSHASYLKMDPVAPHAWKTSTNPVVGFFPPGNTASWNVAVANLKALTAANGWAASNCPAGQQSANGGLLFFDSDTTNVAQSSYNGGSSWVGVPNWSSTNQFCIDGSSCGTQNYHESLYSSCSANPGSICIGSAKKGFNDWPTPVSSPVGVFGSWGSNRIIAQECGQTFLTTLKKSSNFTGTNLTIQLVTWNDYEEGTELETGIDNCMGVTASLSGSVLSWTATTTDNTWAPLSAGKPTNGTVDHWSVYACVDTTTPCYVIANYPLATLSTDLTTLPVPLGTSQVRVQAVGAPFIKNVMSASVTYTH